MLQITSYEYKLCTKHTQKNWQKNIAQKVIIFWLEWNENEDQQ